MAIGFELLDDLSNDFVKDISRIGRDMKSIIIDGFENPQMLHCRFGTMQSELQKFTDWLSENDCHYVAMESTEIKIFETDEGPDFKIIG